MTREETKELLPIMKAYSEGKEIEYSYDGKTWIKTCFPTWNPNLIYRIKPEPKYRPFKSQEECWQEIQKHQPFGWVKEKVSVMLYLINGISDMSIVIMEDITLFEEAMNIYEFKDGTPFGIKED